MAKTVDIESKIESGREHQWAQRENEFTLVGKTTQQLEPGFYEIHKDMMGTIHFAHQAISTQGIMHLEEGNMGEIISDITEFWDMADRYKAFNIAFKRGIMMSGPPGTGKTCIIKLLLADMIQRGGICMDMHPKATGKFVDAVAEIRKVQPDTPILAVIEDFQKWMVNPEFLNMMDGLVPLHKVVIIATTNYWQELPDTILNRPGRFDAHFKIDFPGPITRRALLETMIPEQYKKEVNLENFVKDSKGFSMGHMKELVTAVLLFKKDYKETVRRLKGLREGVVDDDSEDDSQESENALGDVVVPEGIQFVCSCGSTDIKAVQDDDQVETDLAPVQGECLGDDCDDQDCNNCGLND